MKRIIKCTDWLNKFNANDVDWGTIHREQYHSFRNLISRYNKGRGYDRGLFLHHKWLFDTATIVVVCEPLRDHINNCNNGNKDAWRAKIPPILDWWHQEADDHRLHRNSHDGKRVCTIRFQIAWSHSQTYPARLDPGSQGRSQLVYPQKWICELA